jgi:hypothetical protein
MAHSNALIASLSSGDAAALRPRLKNLELKQKQILFEAGSSARCVALQCPRISGENHAATFQQNGRTFVPTLLRCVGKLASHPRSVSS